MSKIDIRPKFECQNAIFGPNSNVKIDFKYRILTIQSFFVIRTGAEYQTLAFEILYLQSNSDRISLFDIQNSISFPRPNIEFWHS